MPRIPPFAILLAFAILRPQHCLAEGYADVRVATLQGAASKAYNGQAIAYPDTKSPEVTILEATFPPGGGTGWHYHPVPVYAYMLDGELTVELEGGAKKTFRKGEAIIEVVNLRHNGINTGDRNARLVVFYTGAAGTANVVRTPAPTPSATPGR